MASSYAESMRAIGLIPLEAQQARATFMKAASASQIVRARILPRGFATINTTRGPWSFLDRLQHAHEPLIINERPVVVPQKAQQMLTTLYNLDTLMDIVKIAAGAIIGEDVEVNSHFAQYKLDSLAAIELSTSLGKTLGKDLPGTLIYDYPSIEEVAIFLHKLLSSDNVLDGENGERSTMEVKDGTLVTYNNQKRAIKLKIGARLPGNSNSEAFSFDAMNTVPYSRYACASVQMHVMHFFLAQLPLLKL